MSSGCAQILNSQSPIWLDGAELDLPGLHAGNTKAGQGPDWMSAGCGDSPRRMLQRKSIPRKPTASACKHGKKQDAMFTHGPILIGLADERVQECLQIGDGRLADRARNAGLVRVGCVERFCAMCGSASGHRPCLASLHSRVGHPVSAMAVSGLLGAVAATSTSNSWKKLHVHVAASVIVTPSANHGWTFAWK